jgi:ribosomal protein L29
MKKSDKISYHQKTIAELEALFVSAQKKLIESRIKHSNGQLKDSSVFKKLKYEMALILTIISKKQNEKN